MEDRGSGCPRCSGLAVEITDSSDDQRRFLCAGHVKLDGRIVGGCGNDWYEPFPEIDLQPGEAGWKL